MITDPRGVSNTGCLLVFEIMELLLVLLSGIVAFVTPEWLALELFR